MSANPYGRRVYPKLEYVTWYRVAKSFKYAGRTFAEGEKLAEDDPVVRALSDARPDLLLVRVQRKEF